ncbi:unnamed protein product [marine sediment metagenome]|uniref:HNH nuclease domain-containing protein n=1 Tax=marine sediment metagenome TaxID=412755 RepID=X1EB76_9ZZZZ
MSDSLVLNRVWYPIHITGWERAISLLYLGHAVAVDPEDGRTYNFEDWASLSKMKLEIERLPEKKFVRSMRITVMIPEVITLLLFDKLPPTEVKMSRKTIFERDNFTCAYCGKKFPPKKLTWDHIVPLARGGKREWLNIVTACQNCNIRKGGCTPEEAKMKILYKPTVPKWKNHLGWRLGMEVKVKESWQQFLDRVYWNAELEP